MTYPPLPAAADVAAHFARSLRASVRNEIPYRTWRTIDVLPLDMCTGILTLPIAPAVIPDRDGTRDTYNTSRAFITPARRADFPALAVLADALQKREVAAQCAETFGIDPRDSYLRVEYIQDVDGCWLEPHRDIPEKLFSMVVYLCTGPEAKTWGTDIYDDLKRRIGRSSAEFNTAVTFIAGPNTWHGFDKRPINGVRRLMEINYVRNWRDREQLAFPDTPVA